MATTNEQLRIFEGNSQGEVYAKARRVLGPGHAFIWKKPNGVMLALRTDSAEEVPVVQSNGYWTVESDNPHLQQKWIKEAQQNAMDVAEQEYAIQSMENYYTGQPAQAIAVKPVEGTPYAAVFNGVSGEQLATSMPEITVNGLRSKHRMRTNIQTGEPESAEAGFVPVHASYTIADGNSILYNPDLGEYEMIDRNGEILAQSYDKNVLNDKTLWTLYHTGRNGDYLYAQDQLERNLMAQENKRLRLQEENRIANGPTRLLVDQNGNQVYDKNGNPIYVGQLTEDQLVDDMNRGKQIFATSTDAANHLVMGGLRMATDKDYTFGDYKEGFFLPEKHTAGLGDAFDVQNTDARFALNFVNPSTALATLSTTGLPYMTLRRLKGKPMYMRVSSAKNPTAVFRRGNQAHEGMGTTHHRPSAGNRTQHGGKHTSAGTGDIYTQKINTDMVVPVRAPGNMDPRLYQQPIWGKPVQIDNTEITPPYSVEYQPSNEEQGRQYNRMFGGDENSIQYGVDGSAVDANVDIHSSDGNKNERRSGARLVSKNKRVRRNTQDTGNIDISN